MFSFFGLNIYKIILELKCCIISISRFYLDFSMSMAFSMPSWTRNSSFSGIVSARRVLGDRERPKVTLTDSPIDRKWISGCLHISGLKRLDSTKANPEAAVTVPAGMILSSFTL
jgi:hypothetical protein